MVKFSIIIPNYNKEPYIKECLDSVFKQKFKDYEVIFIDDASTDASLDIVKNYPVKILKTPHLQAGGARNLGLEVANGEYIVFLDSDDYLCENALENLDNLIIDEDIIILNYIKNENGNLTLKKEPYKTLKEIIANSTHLGVPTKCFKRNLIENLKFPIKQRFEDMVFTLEAMCKSEKIAILEEPFFVYRKVPNSNVTKEIDLETMLLIYKELLNIYPLCIKYPKYKNELLIRLKKDKLDKRLEIIETLVTTGENHFREYFK